MHLLDNLSDQSIVVMGILWILREVFGFVGKALKLRNGNSRQESVRAMERVSNHISAQTALIQEMTHHLKTINDHLSDLKGDMREQRVRH